MLDIQKIIQSLNKKKREFINQTVNCSDSLTILKNSLEKRSNEPYKNLKENLSNKTETPGAIPTSEWNDNTPTIKFEQKFNNHHEARQWALNTLINKTTIAVDGSQIYPSKDIWPEVAAIQVSKFENFHTTDGKYSKDIDFDVISSFELSDCQLLKFNLQDQQESDTDTENIRAVTKEDYINFKRFEKEVNTIIDYLQKNKNTSNKPVVFFDGSLIGTFITAFGATKENTLYKLYIKIFLELLNASEKTRVPLVSYIDTSGAHDLVDMICHLEDITRIVDVKDTQLIDNYLNWGDRTPAFQCKRGGVQTKYKSHKDKLYFCYLKTNSNYPARLEFPEWLFREKALFQEVIDIVRAEVIIGNGYIYSIESADAAAVITSQDKQTFYRIFSDFAIQNKLSYNFSQKTLSKTRRR